MSDLDDKLESLLYIVIRTERSTGMVRLIKQAFADAGYVKHSSKAKDLVSKQLFPGDKMTGAEWYAKFEAEIEKYNQQDSYYDEIKELKDSMPSLKMHETALLYISAKLMTAAKRASGLADD